MPSNMLFALGPTQRELCCDSYQTFQQIIQPELSAFCTNDNTNNRSLLLRKSQTALVILPLVSTVLTNHTELIRVSLKQFKYLIFSSLLQSPRQRELFCHSYRAFLNKSYRILAFPSSNLNT